MYFIDYHVLQILKIKDNKRNKLALYSIFIGVKNNEKYTCYNEKHGQDRWNDFASGAAIRNSGNKRNKH